MLRYIAAKIFGKFESKEEFRKFGMLALIFGLIIAYYWTLRPIKDSVFNAIVGGEHLWLAKILSVFIVVPLIFIYSKLVDTFARHKVFYLLVGIYAVATMAFMIALAHPTIGLLNTVPDQSRYLGWAFYCFVETFGSIIIALFWVLVTDMTLPEAAERGFPIIALFGQFGNIVGPFFLNTNRLGLTTSAPIVGLCSLILLAVISLMWFFVKTTPKALLTGYHGHAAHGEKIPEPGFFEGIKLIFTNGYLFGVFAIITIYEMIVTVIDYHFKQTAFATFSTEAGVSAFLSEYATLVGVVACICLVLGVSRIQRLLGITASLFMLPVLMIVAIITVKFNPTSLTIALWIMVLAKAINYALNQPTMKQLYIPTSKEARYKSQGWIEMFGGRNSKAAASVFNGYRKTLGVSFFLTTASLLSLGLIAAWFLTAFYVARAYNHAIKNNEVVC